MSLSLKPFPLFLLALLCRSESAFAQTVRVAPPRILINITGSLTVSATPGNVSFTLTPGSTADASSPIVITTQGSNIGVLNSLSLYAYFNSSAALTSAQGVTIPSSSIFGSSDAQPGYQPFTGNSPFATGTSLLVFRTTSLLNLLTPQGHQNTLQLRIDLSGTPHRAAGQYSGSLILQAQAL